MAVSSGWLFWLTLERSHILQKPSHNPLVCRKEHCFGCRSVFEAWFSYFLTVGPQASDLASLSLIDMKFGKQAICRLKAIIHAQGGFLELCEHWVKTRFLPWTLFTFLLWFGSETRPTWSMSQQFENAKESFQVTPVTYGGHHFSGI